MKHPNAFAAAVTTVLAAILLRIAHRLGYADLTPVQSVGAAGVVISYVLFLGDRIWKVGLIGFVKRLLHGAKAVIVGQPATTEESK